MELSEGRIRVVVKPRTPESSEEARLHISDNVKPTADRQVDSRPGENPGTAILEQSDQSIRVAAHAGDRYSKANEAASLRLSLDRSAPRPVAEISELPEADFARGSGAAVTVLHEADRLARESGVDELQFEMDERQLEGVPDADRRALILTMRREGFDVAYRTRTPRANERLIRETGPTDQEQVVIGESVLIRAVTDLRPETERQDRHLVPSAVMAEADDAIARSRAERDSRIQGRALTARDGKILKGYAGEGRTYVDLLTRYDRDPNRGAAAPQ